MSTFFSGACSHPHPHIAYDTPTLPTKQPHAVYQSCFAPITPHHTTHRMTPHYTALPDAVLLYAYVCLGASSLCFAAGPGSVCLSSTAGLCIGSQLAQNPTIKTCPVDICFLMDGSGSISSTDFQLQGAVVDALIKANGDPSPTFAAVAEFSDDAIPIVLPRLRCASKGLNTDGRPKNCTTVTRHGPSADRTVLAA